MDKYSIGLKIDQIKVLVAKDFKLKYDSTALGFVWCFLVPTLMSLVYYVVFGIVLNWGRCENYLLYIVCGNFLWQFFSNIIALDGNILFRNAVILKKTSFDHKLLVWSAFFSEAFHFTCTLPILICLMLLYGVTPDIVSAVPNFLVASVSFVLLSVGLGYLYAAVNLFIRDTERIMQVIMRIWLYATPVFIPEMLIPEKYMFWYKLNPLTSIMMIWRNIFYTPQLDWSLYAVPLIECSLIFLIGRMVFIRRQPLFAEKM